MACPLPRVDVGMLTYNTRDLSVEALRRIMTGTTGVDLRVLVRDNASQDGTAQAIAEAFPDADVDAGDENLGFAAGVNTLLARSSAPYFLALNGDAWPEAQAIATLVVTAERHPRAAAVAPLLLRPDGSLEHSTYPFPSIKVAAVTAVGADRWAGGRLGRHMLLEGGWHHDEPRVVDWAVGAALLMRREAVDSIGGFDERFFMYAEDVEWCWRANRRGWEIRFEPTAVVRHVGNASGRGNYGRRRTRTYLHNTYRFYRDEHGTASTVAYRALNLVGCARLYAAARLRGDFDGRAFWADHVRAHLAPATGADRPPG